jgi:hypothetical protein
MGIGDGRLQLRNIYDREHRAEKVVRVVPNAQFSSFKPRNVE